MEFSVEPLSRCTAVSVKLLFCCYLFVCFFACVLRFPLSFVTFALTWSVHSLFLYILKETPPDFGITFNCSHNLMSLWQQDFDSHNSRNLVILPRVLHIGGRTLNSKTPAKMY